MVGIYTITSPSGSVYIGQAQDILRRWREYKTKKCKGQIKLYNSFLKYGVENHIFETIHYLPINTEQEILDQYEQFYMDAYRERGIELLNLKEAGSHGKHSEESKNKISESHNKKINQHSKNGWLIKKWSSISEAARILNINKANICSCAKNKLKSAGGFIWKYN
jgi:group I intron endonuclease